MNDERTKRLANQITRMNEKLLAEAQKFSPAVGMSLSLTGSCGSETIGDVELAVQKTEDDPDAPAAP